MRQHPPPYTQPESPNKWPSQITEASQACHRLSSSALIYKRCPRGFSGITNPTGWPSERQWSQTSWKKKQKVRQCCITPSRNRCRDASQFIIDFQGQHLVVIVCLTRPRLAPCSSSTTGCHMEQPFTTLAPRLAWHHAEILTSPVEFPRGTDSCSCCAADIFLKVFLSRWSIQTLQRRTAVLPSCRPDAWALSADNRYSQAPWPPMFMSEITGVFVGLQS